MPIINLFPKNTDYLDFSFFMIEKATLFLILVSIAIILFTIIAVHFIKKAVMVNRLKKHKIVPTSKKSKKQAKEATFDFIKTNEDFEYKFVWSNEFLGIKTKEIYYIAKFICLGVFLLFGFLYFILYSVTILQFVLIMLILGIVGWKGLDFLLWQERKDRVKSIKENMPMLLISFDNYSKAGLVFDDVLSIVPQFIYGPLQAEFVRFSVSYMVSKDFEKCLKEFSRRLGCDEGEEIELKLRQVYYSGIYEDMLTNEKELIEQKVINDIKKESGMYELYMAIAMCLMIINIFLLSVVPLITVAGDSFAMVM